MLKVKHKIFILLFIILFAFFIFFHVQNKMGLFFDTPALFSSMFYQFLDSDIWFYHIELQRVRNFTNLLIMIPFNIIIHTFKNLAISNMVCIFAVLYYLVEICIILFNFIIAKITKRYDIAIISFAFYCIFILPNIIWANRGEMHIALLIYFAVLSVFLAKEKLKKIHLLLILPLIIYLFESFETTIIFGTILFVSSLIFSKKENNINKNYQILMGVGSFLASIYIIFKLIFLQLYKNVDLERGINGWIYQITDSIDLIFSSSLIIFLFGFIILISLIFYKKDLGKKSLLFFIPYFSLMLIFLYFKTKFISYPALEIEFWGIAFIAIYPIIILILAIDYLNFDILKYNKFFYKNIILLSCIIGIFNLSWQFLNFDLNKKLLNYIKDLKSNSNEVIVTIPDSDYCKYYFLNRNKCYGIVTISTFLSEEYLVERIVLPSPKHTQNDFCDVNGNNFFYKKDIDNIVLKDSWLKVKSQYFDLSILKDEFIKRNWVYP